MRQKFHFYVNSSYKNSYPCALCLRAILCREITNTKHKNGKHVALNRLGKEYLVIVWDLKAQGSLVGCQLGTYALGDSNVLLVYACPSMAVKEPWVLFWRQGAGGINCIYTHTLKKIWQCQRLLQQKHTIILSHPNPSPSHCPSTHTSTWFSFSGQPVSLVSCIFF